MRVYYDDGRVISMYSEVEVDVWYEVAHHSFSDTNQHFNPVFKIEGEAKKMDDSPPPEERRDEDTGSESEVPEQNVQVADFVAAADPVVDKESEAINESLYDGHVSLRLADWRSQNMTRSTPFELTLDLADHLSDRVRS